MSERPSPWLGGEGARWAQALLLVLHAALVIALAVCILTFWRLLPRLDIPSWQRTAVLAGLGVSLVVFATRGARIALDLWSAFRSRSSTGRSGR